MNVVNHITAPGGIRRVDLSTDLIRIQLTDGQDRLYRLVSVVGEVPPSLADDREIVNNIWKGENNGNRT